LLPSLCTHCTLGSRNSFGIRANSYRSISAEHRFPPIARALLLLSPLFLIMAILIKLDSPGPVPFLQRR
jgi:hypothetical protein